ncbi:MAG: polynucleotide adenylyltransferase PcnB, partial [Paraburkholderia sp.]|nr:polynucleotide adenylyltransferase PcnB [Paraburkholderia sp.]
MIKKLIRKLFGQDPAPADDTTTTDRAPSDPDETARASSEHADAPVKTRRKPARAAASKEKQGARDPDVPVIIPSEIHGIDPSLISKNAIRVTEGLQQAGHRA